MTDRAKISPLVIHLLLNCWCKPAPKRMSLSESLQEFYKVKPDGRNAAKGYEAKQSNTTTDPKKKFKREVLLIKLMGQS